jgi:hypothetical protein
MAAFLGAERLIAAACAGSLASFVLKLHDTLRPGLPQSQVLASKHIPFFAHQILVVWIAALVWLAAGRLAPRLRPYLGALVAASLIATVATSLLQWFFPNY